MTTLAEPCCNPKAELRRRQILDAAAACVRKSGFHRAGMAEIAREAGLSVGQIYRYFDNKEAIIAAFVEQDLAEMRERFADFEAAGAPIAETVISRCGEAVERVYGSNHPALMLEVMAEAARNPEVARIVQAADQVERQLASRLFEDASPLESAARRTARAEVVAALFDGLAVRSINNPGADRSALTAVLASVLRHLFFAEHPEAAPAASGV